jgi:DTW domain-containing protein YfiP
MPRGVPARNRIHAVLLKSDPAAVQLSSAWQLDSMAEYRGTTGLAAAAGRRRYCTLCAKHGTCVQARDASWKLSVLFPSSSFHPDAKDMLASSLVREILAASSERAELSAELGRLLQDDKTYRCLLTILGIGPRAPRRSPPHSS